MDERDLLFIRIQLEELISEREGMIAENAFRANRGEVLPYTEEAFNVNAMSINALRGRF